MLYKNNAGVVWFAFYGATLLIAYRMFFGDPDAKMAFQAIMWLRAISIVFMSFIMGDPYRIYQPEPRKLETVVWIICGELWIWFSMFAQLFYTELVVTILAIILFESTRYEAVCFGRTKED